MVLETFLLHQPVTNTRATNEHPTLPGPALFHVEQDEKVFHYFAKTLIELKPEFANTLFLGSDRDKALVNGFTRPLPFVSSLFCKKHVDDINHKMSEDLGYIPLSERKEILTHIFGCEKRKEKGLIDAVSEEEFDRKLLVLSRKWDNLEMSMRNEPPQFSAYFRKFIAEDMKKGMILAVRQAAGLNDNFFFNNTSESINFRYKNKIKQFKAKSQHSGKPDTKCTWGEAIDIYKVLLEEHYRNVARALGNYGPYKVVEGYENFF